MPLRKSAGCWLLADAPGPDETTMLPADTTGKPVVAVRQNLCRAFYFGCTAKSLFAVHSEQTKCNSF
jgi:hypothetical protein